MNRVRVLLLGLLALFFCSPVYAETYIFHTQNAVIDGSSNAFVNAPVWTGTSWTLNSTVQVVSSYYQGNAAAVQCTDGNWSSLSAVQLKSYATSVALPGISLGTVKTFTLAFLESLYPDGCPGTCDSLDDDGDGICNSCDTNPGLPDKKHCIWSQAFTADGQSAYAEIDQSGNCDGSSIAKYKNSAFDGQTQYFDVNDKDEKEQIDAPNCAGADDLGGCSCQYPKSDTSWFTTSMESTNDSPSDLQQEQNNQENQPDSCSGFKSNCDSACNSRGGAKSNSCTTSSSGTIHASCVCNNDSSYNVTKDSDTTTYTPTDTDGDGTSDSGDIDQTGGSDSNNDGVSDVYAAVKGAINDSGLPSKIDSANSQLNSIGNAVSSLVGSTNSLNSSINGVGDSLGTKLDGIGTEIGGLGDKLDSINDKLDDGFEATGSADLPNENSYDSGVEDITEDNLGEAIGNFISGGLPLVSYFQGTYIDIGSSSPALSTEIYGRTVSIDFTGLEDILNNMGLVLVAIATVLAFMIIVHKG